MFRSCIVGCVLIAYGCAGNQVREEPAQQVRPSTSTAPAPRADSAAAPTAAPAPAAGELVPAGEAALPPSVLSGDASLRCKISSKENGAQTLTLKRGQGLEFDIIVSPIVDGVVETKGPEHGGAYRFTSHLAKPGQGTLSGVGHVTFEQLETRVNVEMQRYLQPQGAGTELSFKAEDMAQRGIYVEFAGRARADNGERYAFRVTLGAAGPGSGGSVTPASDARAAPIMSKMVMIEAPQTTVVAATTVQKLR